LKMWTQKLKTKTHTRPTAALRAAGKKDNFFNELKAVHRDKKIEAQTNFQTHFLPPIDEVMTLEM